MGTCKKKKVKTESKIFLYVLWKSKDDLDFGSGIHSFSSKRGLIYARGSREARFEVFKKHEISIKKFDRMTLIVGDSDKSPIQETTVILDKAEYLDIMIKEGY